MLTPGDVMHCASSAPWAMRTLPERDMVEHMLIWYFPRPVSPDERMAARAGLSATLARWCAVGLPSDRDRDGGRCFDPVEVTNFFVAVGRDRRDPYWAQHHAASQAAQQLSFEAPTAAVPMPRALPPRRFRVRLRRDYNLAGFDAGSRVRLRLPVPIADRGLDLLSIGFTAPSGARQRVSSDRFEAQFELDVPAIVTLGFDALFDARADLGAQEALSAEDVKLYTAPREGLIAVSPAIVNLARRIVGDAAPDHAAVLKFYDYIIDNFLFSKIPYHALDERYPADWPIDHGWFDCQMGTVLLCSLCRSIGIPARVASGYQLYDGNQSYHYWAEIWLDGCWLPFDLSIWEAIHGGGPDGWRRAFAGQVDYRLKVQVLPKYFTGAASLALPPRWHHVVCEEDGGTTTKFVNSQSNDLVYRDHVEIVAGG